MIGLYIAAKVSETNISLLELIKLKFQGIDTKLFVRAIIVIKKGELDIQKEKIISLMKEKHNVMNIINVLIFSKKNNLDITIEEAIRGDEMGIDFMNEFKDVENKQQKIKELRNRILFNN